MKLNKKSVGPILLVVSSSPELHDPSHHFERVSAGNDISEVGHLLLAAESVSDRVVVATRNASYSGGYAPLNIPDLRQKRYDLDPHLSEVKRQVKYIRSRLERTTGLFQLQAKEEFEAILVAGGLGGLDDYFGCQLLGQVISKTYKAGGIVATNSHGAVALHLAQKPDGTPLVRGHKFTCSSAAEDAQRGLTGIVQVNITCQLESLLGGLLGGIYSKASSMFAAHVVEDGNLITGQNAASAKPLAALVRQRLLERADR